MCMCVYGRGSRESGAHARAQGGPATGAGTAHCGTVERLHCLTTKDKAASAQKTVFTLIENTAS